MKIRLLAMLLAVLLFSGMMSVCAAYTPDARAQEAFSCLTSDCVRKGVRDGAHYQYSETRGAYESQWLKFTVDYDASARAVSILLKTHNLGADNWLEQLVVDQTSPAPLTLYFATENGAGMEIYGETYLTKSVVPDLYKALPFDFDKLHAVDQNGNRTDYLTPDMYEQCEVWNGGSCKILTDYLDELLTPGGFTWRDLASDTKPDAKPPVTVIEPEDFEDVAHNHYAYQPIMWAREKGITQGTSAKRFSPNDTCTRAQVVTFLWRARGCPDPKSHFNPFRDVAADAYYYDAVLWAVEQGITQGVDHSHFAPNDGCTRGQVVTFLYRDQEGYVPENADNQFTDVKSGAFYYDPVLWALNFAITTGETSTTFAPNKICTRAQIVTFLFRTYEATWRDFA